MEFTFKYGIHFYIWNLLLHMEFTLNMEFTFTYVVYF